MSADPKKKDAKKIVKKLNELNDHAPLKWMNAQLISGAGCFQRIFNELRSKQLNVIITGQVGGGKSSMINALFGEQVADVSGGPDPHTLEIVPYVCDHITLWDTPGFGNGRTQDEENSKLIAEKMSELGTDGSQLIDLALVVVDCSSRDLDTAYLTIDKLKAAFGQSAESRTIVALNKADRLAQGLDSRCWDSISYFLGKTPRSDNSCDGPILRERISNTIASFKRRIGENCGIEVHPFCCCVTNKYNMMEAMRRIIMKNIAVERPAVRARMKIADDEGKRENLLKRIDVDGK